jgi:hypothetical protein
VTSVPLPNLILVILYGFGALFGFLFMIALAKTDWFRHAWGRNVMGLSFMLALTESFAFTSLFLRGWPGRIWIGVVLVGGIVATQAWRWVLQLRGNRRQRRAAQARQEVDA